MKELYITRHGQTDYNKEHIVQGRGINSSLNEFGRKQARQFFEDHKAEKFDAIYVSSLDRTHQSMANFEKEQQYELLKRPQIDEISWGIHEGMKPSAETHGFYKELMESWASGKVHVGIEGGETPYQVADRLKEFMAELKETSHEKVLICTHGRTMRIFICLLLGEPLSNMQKFGHSNLILYKVNWNGVNGEVEYVQELVFKD